MLCAGTNHISTVTLLRVVMWIFDDQSNLNMLFPIVVQ